MQFEVFLSQRETRWNWWLRGDDGEVLTKALQSFHTREECLNSIDKVRRVTPITPIKFLT